jgi:hypothetical protein
MTREMISTIPTAPVTYLVQLKGHAQAVSEQEKKALTKLVNAFHSSHVIGYAKKVGWQLESGLRYFRGPARSLTNGVHVVLDGQGETVVGDQQADRYWLRLPQNGELAAIANCDMQVLMDEKVGRPIGVLQRTSCNDVLDALLESCQPQLVPALKAAPRLTYLKPFRASLQACMRGSLAEQNTLLLMRGWTPVDLINYTAPAQYKLTGSQLVTDAVRYELEKDLTALQAEIGQGA